MPPRVTMSDVSTRRYVTVPVTTLWTSPTAPREIDAPAVASPPDVEAWLADLDAAEERLGLHGRVLTQLELGEPVDVVDDADNPDGTDGTDHTADARWLQVVAPLQPSSLDARGYPGWVLAAHVGAGSPGHSPLGATAGSASTVADLEVDADEFISTARQHLGLPYLWGGMCDAGLDCSGLVHLSLRRLGVVVPRDADDQYDACEPISAADARPGDLFFFAHEGKRPHHVGIVTGPGRMLHAPQTGARIVEEDLSEARRDTLIGAGRLPALVSRG